MSGRPLISIITVNLNDVKGLEKTLKSVFEQTWQEFEFIVVDGASSDGSKKLIESHNEKIDCWVSEPDSGIYNAMNKGIEMSSGEYLLFLNSGDHFHRKNILYEVRNLLKDFSIIYFNMNVSKNGISNLKKFPSKLSFFYFTKDTLPHQGSFLKKTLFQDIGLYDEKMKISSDWKFFIDAICKYNTTYKKYNKVLCTHYLDGVSAKPENLRLIQEERRSHLNLNYRAFMLDLKSIEKADRIITNLKNSIRMRLLIKLGIIQNFYKNLS